MTWIPDVSKLVKPEAGVARIAESMAPGKLPIVCR